MKYIVHVTTTMSVEVDSDQVRKEFGKVNKHLILEEAKGRADLLKSFATEAVIFEKCEQIKKIKKGRGSY